MHVRVVRFTGVDAERMQALRGRIDESDGPPEGVDATGIQVLVDAEQQTAVVLQFFETADAMAAAEQVFDSMDASDTPGSRASIDRCESVVEMHAASA